MSLPRAIGGPTASLQFASRYRSTLDIWYPTSRLPVNKNSLSTALRFSQNLNLMCVLHERYKRPAMADCII